jgi:ABC-2 type transport system permease protein
MSQRMERRGLSLRAELRVLGGFFYRRMAVFLSNRTNTLFGIAEIVAFAVFFGWTGRFITRFARPELGELLQGTPDYTTFLVVGHLVSIMVWSAEGNLTWLVHSREFPNLYMAPCRLPTLILGANMWKYTWIVIQVVLFLLISSLLFGVRVHLNASFAVVVLGGILVMTALDMIGAGFKVITKSQSDPLNWILGITGVALSGQFIPVEALPGWVAPLSRLHPQYHINTFARRTMGQGLGLSQVWPQLWGFLLTAVAFLLVGYLIFRAGFRRARVEGTLGYV